MRHTPLLPFITALGVVTLVAALGAGTMTTVAALLTATTGLGHPGALVLVATGETLLLGLGALVALSGGRR